jgi:selenocysteine lyase/cysteine desulfurase
LPCDAWGYLPAETLERALAEKKTDLVVLSCASNVCGAAQDIDAISRLCRAEGAPLVLDAAQTAGHVKTDLRETPCSAFCFTGHKGLFGPQGTGGVVWDASFAEMCAPFIEGGTGSFSDEERQPSAMPDKFEAGTPNMPGIAGLRAALGFLRDEGLGKITRRCRELDAMLLEGLSRVPGTAVCGARADMPRVPVVAMNFENIDNARAAFILQAKYGIETRPSLHCSPLAHKTLGTFPQGALRISPGYFNTEEEIEYTLNAIREIAQM